MLDQQQGAERRGLESAPCTPIYRRPMPGGGYVEVELDPLPTQARQQLLQFALVIADRTL